MNAEQALRQLIEDADRSEVEAKRLGLWVEDEWGSRVIRAIQKYRVVLDALAAERAA